MSIYCGATSLDDMAAKVGEPRRLTALLQRAVRLRLRVPMLERCQDAHVMRERGQHHADVENLVGRKEVVELPRPQPLKSLRAPLATHTPAAAASAATPAEHAASRLRRR